MPNHIFPSTVTKFSTESLIKKHSTRSKAIYWLLLFVVLGFGISIFYIEVDVNIYSRGIITSKQQTTQIMAPIFGKVILAKLIENSFVTKGDTLLQLDTINIIENIRIIQANRMKPKLSDLIFC